MPSQTTTIRKRQKKTAEEPISFALPDNSCRSGPIRSTAFSMALLMSSTIISRNNGAIRIIHSTTVRARRNDRISRNPDMKISCLKADSWRHASRMPLIEFLEAAVSLLVPVNPGFTMHDSLLMILSYILPTGIMRKKVGNNNQATENSITFDR